MACWLCACVLVCVTCRPYPTDTWQRVFWPPSLTHLICAILPPPPLFRNSFNQLDLPEYENFEQLRDALKMAITEASEGFGFG